MLLGEMRRDLGAPRLGECPSPRRHPQVKLGDATYGQRLHESESYFVLAPVVFGAFSTKAFV